MASLNKIILIGRLTKDPDVRTTGTGLTVALFSIAVNRPKSSQQTQEETDFFRVTAWRQTAEYVSNYLGKGRLVAVEGRLQNRNWVDKDGQTRYDFEIVADRVEGLDRPRDTDGAAPAAAGGGTADEFPPEDGDKDTYDPFAEE